MTQEDYEMLSCKMDSEGFDYCFTNYSDWKEIKDKKFHKLREAYLDAGSKLRKYIESFGDGESSN